MGRASNFADIDLTPDDDVSEQLIRENTSLALISDIHSFIHSFFIKRR